MNLNFNKLLTALDTDKLVDVLEVDGLAFKTEQVYKMLSVSQRNGSSAELFPSVFCRRPGSLMRNVSEPPCPNGKMLKLVPAPNNTKKLR